MKFIKLVATLAVLSAGLVACGGNGTSSGGSGGGTTQALTLNVDQMPPVPLVNGKPQTFYMYATNYGNTQLSNLSWSAQLQSASTTTKNDSAGMLASIKSKLSSLTSSAKVNPQDETNPITILDASQCTAIAAGGSCRVELQATAAGVVMLSATSGTQAVTLEGGGGMVQAQTYPTSYSGENNSTTPSLTGKGSLSNSFNMETKARAAQISVSVVPGQENNFNAIEQGITNPTLELKISNRGNGAVKGSMTLSDLSGTGISSDFSTCTNLPADKSCIATLTLSTLKMVTDCASGDGITTTCMNNPSMNGGTASTMKVKLTFTNTGSVAATSVSLPADSLKKITDEGYTAGTNTVILG